MPLAVPRKVLTLVSALLLAPLMMPAAASAQAQNADNDTAAKLAFQSPLGEKAFGDPKAPVTLIEYASLACHHCRDFHIKTWPAFKAKYVDAGKVRFVIREFPLDPLAAAGFMLARCAGETATKDGDAAAGDARWYAMVDLLYATQEAWSHAEKPVDGLAQAVRQAGMGREPFEACLRHERIYKGVVTVAEHASLQLKVTSTPTFFVNGQREVGALSLEQFDKMLEPLLAAKAAPAQ
jgi:protein-disulfide isomerase